jgi:hypothetical protein
MKNLMAVSKDLFAEQGLLIFYCNGFVSAPFRLARQKAALKFLTLDG